MIKHTEQIQAGPAIVRIEVETGQPMEWVLDDTTFLDYRLGTVSRTRQVTTPIVDLLWDRTVNQKTIAWRDNQMFLTGPWEQGELQKILVTLTARRMEEKGVYLFHSSAVRYRNKSILFMTGENNSGKTMTQIEARRRGGAFISTETTVVDARTHNVISGSKDIFLIKRAKGTERTDKPSQHVGIQKLFGGEELPDLNVFFEEPAPIDIVVIPDIDGHYDTSVKDLNEFERAYQTFHSLINYMGLNLLLAPGIPMPIVDTEELRYKRAAFIQEFIDKPYYVIRSSNPQDLLDEVEKLL